MSLKSYCKSMLNRS